MSRLRVLVTDDSTFMRQVISRALEGDARFEVVGAASSGAEAIELCRKLEPDLVTMDFNMPENRASKRDPAWPPLQPAFWERQNLT